jgi:hypothetical protein
VPPPVTRPFIPQTAQATAPVVRQQPSTEARAAQRAFFQQALGDTTPVAAPVRAAPVAASAAAAPAARDIQPPVTRTRLAIPEEKPDRILRPGSFVDVKV